MPGFALFGIHTATHMGNTYTSLHYHFIFSTKHREPWISQTMEERVWSFLGGIARENKLVPILVGGMPDHIHMAVGAPPTIFVSKVIQQIKGGSSKWIKDAFLTCASLPGRMAMGHFQ